MAALAKNTKRTDKAIKLDIFNEVPMTDAVIIYQGSLAMITSAGRTSPAVAAASNLGVWGIGTGKGYITATGAPPALPSSLTYSDNTVLGHVAGYISALLEEGIFLLPSSVAVAQANIGAVLYAGNDNEVHLSQAANEPVAGVAAEVPIVGGAASTTTTWVRISMPIAIGR